MPTTAITAQRHVQTQGPYNAVTFAEQNKALVGLSRRLRGFSFVSLIPGTSITIGPGFFISVGLALNPTFPNRIAGIVAETTVNSVLDITALNADFYIFARAGNTVEGQAVDFVTANSAAPPTSQHAAIARVISGLFILEDALGDDGLEAQNTKARDESGANQFLLSLDGGSPAAITITGANLADGTVAAGVAGFTGSPAWTNGVANYVFFTKSTGLITNQVGGFPAANASDIIPLWILTLDGAGLVTSVTDRRPWFTTTAVTAGQGVDIDALSLQVRNQNPKPAWVHSLVPAELTWNATTQLLSWTAALLVEIVNGTNTAVNTIAGPSSLGSIADGDYLYVDVSPAGGAAVLARNAAGPAAQQANRVIFGKRSGTNIILTSGVVILDETGAVGTRDILLPPVGIDLNRWQALHAANAPTGANPYATLLDVAVSALANTTVAGTRSAVGGSGTIVTAVVPANTKFILIRGAVAAGATYSVFNGTINIAANTYNGQWTERGGVGTNNGGAIVVAALSASLPATIEGPDVINDLHFVQITAYAGIGFALTIFITVPGANQNVSGCTLDFVQG